MKQHCCARSKLCCWQEDSQITVDLLGKGILYYGIESIRHRARCSVGFFSLFFHSAFFICLYCRLCHLKPRNAIRLNLLQEIILIHQLNEQVHLAYDMPSNIGMSIWCNQSITHQFYGCIMRFNCCFISLANIKCQ